jgi:hypothetical protein
VKPAVVWPDGRRFAFSIFDDPDSQTWEAGQAVYALLQDLGFRTTKGVWPLGPIREPSDHGLTCAAPGYADWIRKLIEAGFEIGYHCATSHTCSREESLQGLERFHELFGEYPKTAANHYFCSENLYWGDQRLSGSRKAIYNALTRYKEKDRYFGCQASHPLFWGDLARERITYMRNFAFSDANCFKSCPFLPYHDPARPFVNFWYSAAEGSSFANFRRTLTDAAIDRLEQEAGLCLMYVHFGHRFYENGRLQPEFRRIMEAIARRNGWFAPVGTILDYIRAQRGDHRISDAERAGLEWRWLRHKIRFGTA